MDFDLNPVQREHLGRLAEGVRAELGARRPNPDPEATRSAWKTVAALGLAGLCLPEESGGGGLGALDTALSLEVFGRECPDTGLAFAVSAHLLACAVPIRDFAAPEVRGELLAGLATGGLIAANAMTEDGAGSDVGSLAVTARHDGDAYVLDGEKSFASNAPIADVVVTYAVTDPAAGFLGVTGFAVPTTLPGVSPGEPFVKLGLTSCPAGRVGFEDCRVPERYLLGRPGQGGAVFQHSMGWERACLFAVYLGLMDRQLAQCAEHAATRRQFGHAIGRNQAVSHRLATMRLRLESARLLLYRACWLLDQDRDHVAAAALAKVATSEAAAANSLDAVRILGGAGYLAGSGVEQQLRDAVPAALFSGTDDIQRELIARELGL